MNTNGWIPLFLRYRDLSSVDEPEFVQLTKELEKTKPTKDELDECSIYTEGMVEERFLEELALRYENFGFSSLRILSIGSLGPKEKLDKYRKITSKTIFITDSELDDKGKPVPPRLKEKDVVFMGNVMKYFDVMKIVTSPICSPLLGEHPVILMEPKLLHQDLEMKLLKRVSPTQRIEVMKELVSNCIINSEVIKLVEKIKKVYSD